MLYFQIIYYVESQLHRAFLLVLTAVGRWVPGRHYSLKPQPGAQPKYEKGSSLNKTSKKSTIYTEEYISF